MAGSLLMRCSWSLQVLVSLWGLPQLLANEQGEGWSKSTDSEGRAVQSLKIQAPTMTEEDQYGYNMPDQYRCDSCRAVMFHLEEELKKKQPKSRRLSEWEFVDEFDKICANSFEGYGIKLVNDQNVLSGPALKGDDSLAPGMGAIQMGGDTWKKRLSEICRKIVYEKVGEEDMYEYLYGKFKAGEDVDGKDFCTKKAKQCAPVSAGPLPPPKAKEEKKKDKPKKAKEKKTKGGADKEKRKEGKSSSEGAKGGKIGAEEFLRQLAAKHGAKSEEYVSSRTPAEWEKFMVTLAGKIFNRQSEEL